MNDLRSRLERMKRMRTSGTSAGKPPAANTVEDPWQRMEARVYGQNETGAAFIIRECRYPFDTEIGRSRAADLIGRTEGLQRLLASAGKRRGKRERIRAFAHDEMLFLDTETTGLGVGTGNVPFMIGLGFYESDAFVVQQLFIRNPAEEAAMLDYLNGLLPHYRCLVTFNGKSFDWPVVATRYIMNRLSIRGDEMEHLDLLYPSRRIWRHVLPSCRLSELETQRLGIERERDVPGSEAPALYVKYLQERLPEVIEPVFLHNEKDILALLGLAQYFADLIEGRLDVWDFTPEEHYRYALLLERMEDESAAAEWESFLARPAGQIAKYYLPIAALYKKKGEFTYAESLWLKYLEVKRSSRFVSLEPYIALAMLYEHQFKEPDRALSMTEAAIRQSAERRALLRGGSGKLAETADDLRRRKERLMRKIANRDRRRISDAEKSRFLADSHGNAPRIEQADPFQNTMRKGKRPLAGSSKGEQLSIKWE